MFHYEVRENSETHEGSERQDKAEFVAVLVEVKRDEQVDTCPVSVLRPQKVLPCPVSVETSVKTQAETSQAAVLRHQQGRTAREDKTRHRDMRARGRTRLRKGQGHSNRPVRKRKNKTKQDENPQNLQKVISHVLREKRHSFKCLYYV